MTTQTTTIQASTKGLRALLGATAASLTVLGGALLWQVRPASETAPTTSSSTRSEGAAPLGGLAEQYQEQQRDRAAREAATPARHTLVVASADQIAEAYAQFVERLRALDGSTPVAVTVVVSGATPEATQLGHMGGMAELYRNQAAAPSMR